MSMVSHYLLLEKKMMGELYKSYFLSPIGFYHPTIIWREISRESYNEYFWFLQWSKVTFFLKNTPFIPLLFGSVFFYLIVGFGPLNPENLSWIFGRFDPPQHYLGWVFYRYAPWTFPIGLSPNFGMDISSSIVYTDSLPLMAIFLNYCHQYYLRYFSILVFCY